MPSARSALRLDDLQAYRREASLPAHLGVRTFSQRRKTGRRLRWRDSDVCDPRAGSRATAEAQIAYDDFVWPVSAEKQLISPIAAITNRVAPFVAERG